MTAPPGPARPKRPYLLRALLEWIVDGELTPYLLVNVDSSDIRVPAEYVTDGRIVLNISPMAVRNLEVGNDMLSFDGRFGGRPFPVAVPLANVMAIYAKETGEGMMFEEEYASGSAAPADQDSGREPDPKPAGPGGHLKVIK